MTTRENGWSAVSNTRDVDVCFVSFSGKWKLFFSYLRGSKDWKYWRTTWSRSVLLHYSTLCHRDIYYARRQLPEQWVPTRAGLVLCQSTYTISWLFYVQSNVHEHPCSVLGKPMLSFRYTGKYYTCFYTRRMSWIRYYIESIWSVLFSDYSRKISRWRQCETGFVRKC